MSKITAFARRKIKRSKKSYFSLNMRENSVFISKKDVEITPWLYISELESKMLDISFPFDFSRGTQQLKNKRGEIKFIDGLVKAKELSELFYQYIPENFKDIALSFFRDRIIVRGVYQIENNSIPFLFKFGIQLRDNRIVFVLLEDYILGKTYKLRFDLLKELFDIPSLEQDGFFTFSAKIFPSILHEIFSANGYKLPNYQNLTFTELLVDNDFIKFKLEDKIDIEKSDIPILKETISKLELYSTKRELFNKIKQSGVTKELRERYGDINTIHHNWVDLKFFLEFLEPKLYITEYLNSIFREKISTDIIVDISLKYKELKEETLFYETILIAVSRAEKDRDYPLLEMFYLYLAYYHKENRSKESIVWFEKLWSLNKDYTDIWFDFFTELIEYKSYFLAVEVGERIAENLDGEEESFIWQKIGYIFNHHINNPKLALKYYAMALRITPNSVILKLDMIDVYIKSGRNLYAIEKLNNILEDEFSSVLKSKINERLYDLWNKEKEYERALFHIEQILKDKKDPKLYYKASTLVRILEDSVRVFDYLALIISHYRFYELKEDELYYKALKELAVIYKEKGNIEKSYKYFSKLPFKYFNEDDVDNFLTVIKLSKKIENIFKYLEYKESFLKNDEQKYNFWREYLNYFGKIYPNRNNYIKTLIRALLNNPKDSTLFKKLVKIDSVKNNEYKKIIDIYRKRLSHSTQEEEIIIYHRIYKIAKINDNSLIMFEILEEAIKEYPENKLFLSLYKEWIEKH